MLWLFFDIRGTPNCQVVRDHLFWWNRHMCHGQKTVFFLVYGHPTIRDVGHINPYSCTHPIWLWRCQPETYSSVGILVPSSQNYPHHPSPKWAKMGQNGSGHALAIGRLAILQLPLLQVLQPTTDLSQTAGVIIKLPFQVEKVRKILQESQNIRIYLLSRSSYLWKCKIYHDSGRSKPWYPSVHTSS